MRINQRKQSGFTLVELVVVVTILGIISYLAVSKFESAHNSLQYNIMIKQIAADLRYARDKAMTGGQGTRFYIDQVNNRYYVKWADGSYLKQPVGSRDFVVDLGQKEFSNTVITATAFISGRLDFDRNGLPKNAGSSFSGELNLVTLNNKTKIFVTANTGYVRVEY